jgi:acetyltransferase-like isoleucine patch superfamily enzyme
MFLKYLLKNVKLKLKQQYKVYKLEQRLENPYIVQPFSVISPDRLKIGKNVVIQRNCHFHCGGLSWSNGQGGITIGENCCISENNVLYGAGEIEIGNCVDTGPNVMIFSSRDDYSLDYARLPSTVHQFGKVTIGSYVIIFSGVIIVPGVTIGEGAVIGAGSIVTKDIPEWTIAMGSPAKVIQKREQDTPLKERQIQAN